MFASLLQPGPPSATARLHMAPENEQPTIYADALQMANERRLMAQWLKNHTLRCLAFPEHGGYPAATRVAEFRPNPGTRREATPKTDGGRI